MLSPLSRSVMSRPAMLGLLLAIALGAYAPIIAEFSLEAYKNATSLKAETMALVDKSGGKYSAHTKQVEELTTKINAAYKFAAGLAANSLSAQQWDLLRNLDGNLYGGLIAVWQKQGTTSPAYRGVKKAQIAAAFDYIICLESNKRETVGCSAAAAAAAARGGAQ
jgi:hypothetical protein